MSKKALSAMDKLRLAKVTGARLTDLTDVSEKKIYDEVSAEEYKNVVAQRRKQGNFVEGDDDLGYADDGEEHFSEDEYADDDLDEEDADLPPSKNAAAGGPPAKKRAIAAMAGKPAAKAPVAPIASSHAVEDKAALAKKQASALQDHNIDDMMGDIDEDEDEKAQAKLAARQAAAASARAAAMARAAAGAGSSSAGAGASSSAAGRKTAARAPAAVDMDAEPEANDAYDAAGADVDYGMDAAAAAEPAQAEADAAMDLGDEEEGQRKRPAVKLRQAPSAIRAAHEAAAASSAAPKPSPAPSALEEPVKALTGVGVAVEAEAGQAAPAGPAPRQLSFEKIKNKASVDVDTCLFYWFDAYEDPYKSPGVIHVFGKVMTNEKAVMDALRHNSRLEQLAKDKEARKAAGQDEDGDEDMDLGGGAKLPVPAPEFVSACLTVSGNERCMFVLPRDKNVRTGEEVEAQHVWKELKDVTLRGVMSGASRFGVKPVTRNYAFELAGVPREPAKYYKLVYSATLPALPADVCGDTFSHIFGTNTSSMEHFLLKRRLLGPCWLRLTGVKNRPVSASFCQVDLEVDGPKCVTVYGGVNIPDKKANKPDWKGVPIPWATAVKWSASERQLVGEPCLPVPTPDLAVVSLSLKTFVSQGKEGKGQNHEIAAASLVFHRAVSQDGQSNEARSATETVTLIRHQGGIASFTPEFRAQAAKMPSLRIMPTEKALLTVLLQYVDKLDPDVLVGHNISGFDLDVLLHRVQMAGLHKMWAKVGRLRRDAMPRTGMGVGGRAQFTGVLTAGRLLCDTYLAARELVRETTYTMAGLAVTQLGLKPGEREDIEPMEVPRMMDRADTAVRLVRHTEMDAWLAMKLMFKLQVLPLTKQLTNAAGNLWSRSLKGARAERIEYLLLHEFHRLKYIVPDKERFGDKAEAKAREAEDEDEEEDEEIKGKKGGKRVMGTGTAARNAKGRGKPAYSGGLVLEPKKGLYDKLVLLLDFNSLYPSIIQEFNICFTTVDRQLTGKVAADQAKGGKGGAAAKAKPAKGKGKMGKRKAGDAVEDEGVAAAEAEAAGDEEGAGAGASSAVATAAEPEDADDEDEAADSTEVVIPAVPDPARYPEQGVLPRVIRGLVDKRKTVKRLLAVEKDPSKKQQLDIRQKAIKILANSMYGCLGFSHSRFHAKPIAALVTSQGRDILQKTVNLATNNHGLDVIYGDTDSVMIYTGMDKLEDVKAKGNQLKADVNKLYRCLEIDIDGIFAMMLLLKKKKYASLKVHELPGGVVRLEREVKGLDMVRRDWCSLSKLMGQQILDILLPKTGPGEKINGEDIVDNIHRLLEKRAGEMRSGAVPLDQFVITKGLNKHPNDYPDAKNQPHLQVAIAMQNAGRPVNVGDHIPYVICCEAIGTVQVMASPGAAPAGGAASPPAAPAAGAGATASPPTAEGSPTGAITAVEGSGGAVEGVRATSGGSVPISQRAYHPDDVRRAAGRLHIDVDWYMTQQILPPIARLCEPIAGTSQARLAECLGLDASRFNRYGNAGVAAGRDDELYVAKHSQLDEERFKACDKLLVKCSKCASESPFAGVFRPPPEGMSPDDARTYYRYGLQCGRPGCEGFVVPKDTPLTAGQTIETKEVEVRMLNAVLLAIRRHTMLAQAGWLVCEDNMCGTRTRAQSGRKAGYACPRPGCNSLLRMERDSSSLHEQLEYLGAMFDWSRAVDKRARYVPGFRAPEKMSAEETADWRKKSVAEKKRIMELKGTLANKVEATRFIRIYATVHKEVDRVLSHSAMHFVDTASMFTYVARANAQWRTVVQPIPMSAFTRQDNKPAGDGPAQSAPAKRSGLSSLPAKYSVAVTTTTAGASGQGAGRASKMVRMDALFGKKAGDMGFMGLDAEA